MTGDLSSGASKFVDGSKRIYLNDKSLDFYKISWEDDKTMKDDADKLDFVSGYAMTDPFEDFAESYAYYILHGTEFRLLTRYNQEIKQKYNYLKNEVFAGNEFINGNPVITNMKISSRDYDVTVLPYDLSKFFII